MQLYKISFPAHLTTKCYIGITSKTAQQRFKEHCQKYQNKLIHRAIKKHGKENAIITVLAECDDWELLCLAEQEAIEKFNTKNPNGYNLTDGGEGVYGLVHNEDTRKKLADICNNRYKDVAAKEKVSKGLKLFYENHPHIKKEISERNKLFNKNNPNNVEKNRQRAISQFSNLENRLIARDNAIKAADSKEYREMLRKNAIKFHLENPEYARNHSKIIKEKYKDPLYKARCKVAQATGIAKQKGMLFSYITEKP